MIGAPTMYGYRAKASALTILPKSILLEGASSEVPYGDMKTCFAAMSLATFQLKSGASRAPGGAEGINGEGVIKQTPRRMRLEGGIGMPGGKCEK